MASFKTISCTYTFLMQAHLHFFVDCVVELFKQSKIESNLDRNSAVPMALDERTPTLNVHRIEM